MDPRLFEGELNDGWVGGGSSWRSTTPFLSSILRGSQISHQTARPLLQFFQNTNHRKHPVFND
jgi:hypothetical protein